MNHQELLVYCKNKFDAMHTVMANKNADYAGAGESGFHNFTMVERLGISSAELGMLTRMSDKFARICTLIKHKDPKVKDESIQDTLIDLANYSVLLCALIESRKEGK